MNVKIYPSKVNGEISAPPSKSVTHRAIIIASLANGKSVIDNALIAEDTLRTIDALKALGVDIQRDGNKITINGSNGKLKAPAKPIFLGNSGSTMRMIAAVCALADGETTLTGEKRLCQRPVGELIDALNKIGIKAYSVNNNGCPPIKIKGGKISGGNIVIKGDISSQYISALLLVAPFAKESLTTKIDGELVSKPYVALTIDIMKTFCVNVQKNNFQNFTIEKGQQYKGKSYTIEGDYSSASYFFAAAAITNGSVTVKNLSVNSSQGDKYFLELLEKMGCYIKKEIDGFTVVGKKLNGIEIDMSDYPDIVQTLTVVAAFAKGTTKINNIGHLRYKESDRIETTIKELKKMGVKVNYDDKSLNIEGGNPKGTSIDTHNDHRVAMSFAIAALGAQGKTVIQNAEVVRKSYPAFFEDLQKIGAKIEVLP
ncbi:MAG: 3-phosphoshikimate 1-carboxyvinyltransferase [Candidatus Levybacteria bacterium]|nr:3-phosphoshikimate 1-carboxyvinyltransferase [Candidatus Levybacteria bacterium]